MVTREQTTVSLLTHILDGCGYSDADKLIDIIHAAENKKIKVNGKDWFLFYVDKEGSIPEMLGDWLEDFYFGSLQNTYHINDAIFGVYQIIVNQISELFNIQLENLVDYEIIADGVASSLNVVNELLPDEVKAALEAF